MQMSVQNNSSVRCVYCQPTQEFFHTTKCYCEDELETINIDRQKYLFLQSPGSWHCFFLKPVKEFLLERGLPQEQCKYCHYTNAKCSCGQKTAFKKSIHYYHSLIHRHDETITVKQLEDKDSETPPTKKARKENSLFYWPSLF